MNRTRREIADAEWRALREQAQTVPCPYCHAEKLQVCRTVDGYELVKFPAHSIRIRTSQETPR